MVKNNIYRVLFWGYLCALFAVTLYRWRDILSNVENISAGEYTYAQALLWHTQLIPFRSVAEMLIPPYTLSALEISVRNIVGNFLLLMPLGFFLPLFQPVKYGRLGKVVCTLLFVTIAIEVVQLFAMMGSCDIDDMIFNVAGGLLGFAIWKFIKRIPFLHPLLP